MHDSRIDEWKEILRELVVSLDLNMNEQDLTELAEDMHSIALSHLGGEQRTSENHEQRKRDPHGTAQAEAQYYGKEEDADLQETTD